MKNRECGILLHISSLPSKYGIGTFGKNALDFVDFLAECNHTYWQILPLCQTNYGDSPYQSCSAFSLNPYFIDLEILQKQRLLKKADFANIDFGQAEDRVNYEKLFNTKFDVLKIAFKNYNKNNRSFKAFLKKGEFLDYAVYMSLKYKFNQLPFQEWEEPYKNRDKVVLDKYIAENTAEIDFWQFVQFICLQQWKKLKAYANSKGIKIIGDMPIYVASDSVEVWTNNQDFILDNDLYPKIVAGCPPDAFTDEGQLWGNPIYNWERMASNDFSWWQHRIEKAMELYDNLRIDHFRGFSSYYTIKRGEINAKSGEWQDGYGDKMFKILEKRIPDMNIIAEDLGYIDEKARKMFKRLGYPGMKILMFAFDGSKDNEHLPSNYTNNFIVYTGTHDNEPLMSYLDVNVGDKFILALKAELEPYKIVLKSNSNEDIAESIIELAYASKAKVCILEMQDLLKQGIESRMNLPSTVSPLNWSYKLENDNFKELKQKLIYLSNKYRKK